MAELPDDAPDPPVEELRQFLRALITWAMWEPPGEAVSGELDVSFPKGDKADAP